MVFNGGVENVIGIQRSHFVIAAGLWIPDLPVPDLIPLAEEILLGVVALLLAAWRKRKGKS